MTSTDQVSDPGHQEYASSTAKSVNAPGFAVSTQVDAKEFADSVISTIPIPLLVLETDLRVRTASQSFYETFQVMPEETEGQLIYQLGNGQWDIPDLRTLLEKILPNDQFFTDYEVEHTFDGIGRCTMLLNGRRLDHIQLILLVITDITKRKQIEVALLESHKRTEATLTQLRDVQAQLVQQERLAAMGGLAAGIAHDFNNILSIILLHTELGLRTPQLLPKLHMQLSTIQQQAKRAAHLIQQILDFGRHTVLQPHPLNLVPFLHEQVELLRRTLSDNIKIGLSYGRDQYFINADATHIQQILTNLAINARDAMPDGGELDINVERFRLVSRGAAPLPGMELGEWLQMSVSDTGTGIPLTLRSRLFEPFFTTKDPGKGTGLGLAQVYGLVRQHQGHIDIHTQEGTGTTFTIYLPALEIQPSIAQIEEPIDLPLGQGETILVAEDNASLREALADTLKLLNYRTIGVANGREALAIMDLHSGDIALVLSDLIMPEMGGRALFHALQQRGLSLPMVMLSGHSLEANGQALQALGLAGWLPKPPTMQQLAAIVAEILQRGSNTMLIDDQSRYGGYSADSPK